MGGGGGKSESESSSTNKTADQTKWLAQALKTYGPQIGQNNNVWQGQRVQPFGTLQNQAVSGAENYADYFSTPQQVGKAPLSDETGTAVKGLLSGDIGAQKMNPQAVQDYFQSTIYNPTMTNLRDEVLPGINEDFSGPGFWNAARSQERTTARKDTAENLGTQWAGLNWAVQNQNQSLDEAKAGRTQAAIPQAIAYGNIPAQQIKDNLQIASQQIGGLNDIFGIGQKEQTQEQVVLESEILKFAEANQITDPENLQILMSLLGMSFSKSESSSSAWNANISLA